MGKGKQRAAASTCPAEEILSFCCDERRIPSRPWRSTVLADELTASVTAARQRQSFSLSNR